MAGQEPEDRSCLWKLENIFPRLRKESGPANTPTLARGQHFRLVTSRTLKRINPCCFQPANLLVISDGSIRESSALCISLSSCRKNVFWIQIFNQGINFWNMVHVPLRVTHIYFPVLCTSLRGLRKLSGVTCKMRSWSFCFSKLLQISENFFNLKNVCSRTLKLFQHEKVCE